MKKLNRKIGLLLLGTGLIISLALLFGRGVLSAEGLGSLATPATAEQSIEPREITGAYRHQMLLPLEDIIAHEKVLIAIVVPVERKSVVVVSDVTLIAVRSLEEQRARILDSSPVEYPFTPVEVEVAEVLKGDIPEKLEVWEERGEVAGFNVDSDDPHLPVGIRGLLIAGRHDNGVIAPLIFAPIQDDGYMPDLQMNLADFGEMLKQ